MAAIPLVRANHVTPIIDFLNQIGTPTDQLLNRLNLSRFCLEAPESLMPLYQSIPLMEIASQLEGIENLGILVGQQVPIHHMGMMGQMLCSSLTLFDLLVTLEEISGLANAGLQLNLRWEPDWVWVQYHCMGPAHVVNLQSQYYATMLHINAIRLALGKTWCPSELRLEGPPCAALLAMDEFSEVQIHFHSPQNGIKIPRSALAQPVNSVANSGALPPQIDYETYLQSAPAQDFGGSLRQIVQALLAKGYPSITQAAEAAGISKRTLQRQMAESGLSYCRLVEQVRFEQATALLKDPGLKLIDIAADLGYTDSANFTRAFKRWAGVSPRDYRLNQSQSPIPLSF